MNKDFRSMKVSNPEAKKAAFEDIKKEKPSVHSSGIGSYGQLRHVETTIRTFNSNQRIQQY